MVCPYMYTRHTATLHEHISEMRTSPRKGGRSGEEEKEGGEEEKEESRHFSHVTVLVGLTTLRGGSTHGLLHMYTLETSHKA